MDQLITRRTDNAMPGISVSLTASKWEELARQFFNWRKVSQARIQALGSHDYDRFISFAAKSA